MTQGVYDITSGKPVDEDEPEAPEVTLERLSALAPLIEQIEKKYQQ
jgi:hypothetical protein